MARCRCMACLGRCRPTRNRRSPSSASALRAGCFGGRPFLLARVGVSPGSRYGLRPAPMVRCDWQKARTSPTRAAENTRRRTAGAPRPCCALVLAPGPARRASRSRSRGRRRCRRRRCARCMSKASRGSALARPRSGRSKAGNQRWAKTMPTEHRRKRAPRQRRQDAPVPGLLRRISGRRSLASSSSTSDAPHPRPCADAIATKQ